MNLLIMVIFYPRKTNEACSDRLITVTLTFFFVYGIFACAFDELEPEKVNVPAKDTAAKKVASQIANLNDLQHRQQHQKLRLARWRRSPSVAPSASSVPHSVGLCLTATSDLARVFSCVA